MDTALSSPAQTRLCRHLDEVSRARSDAEVCALSLECLRDLGGSEHAAFLLDTLEEATFQATPSSSGLLSLIARLVAQADLQFPAVVPDTKQEPGLGELAMTLEAEQMGAFAILPLSTAAGPLGWLCLWHAQAHAFGEAELATARLVGRQASLALAYKALARELDLRVASSRREEEHLRQEEFLAAAAALLSSSLEPDRALGELPALAVPRVADVCVIHLQRPDGRLDVVGTAHLPSAPAQALAAAFTQRGEEASGPLAACLSGSPVLLDRGEPNGASDQLGGASDLPWRSAMLVPLRAHDRTIGCLSLARVAPPQRYDHEDLTRIAGFADRAALTIDHARLFKQVAQARLEAEELAKQVTLLVDANDALAATLDPTSTLEELARLVVPAMADHSVTYAVGPDGRSISRVGAASARTDDDVLEHLVQAPTPRVKDPAGVGMVIRTGRTLFVPDLTVADRGGQMLDPVQRDQLKELGGKSIILVPLRARAHTVGALALLTTRVSGRVYAERDVVLAEELASRAALFVDNARLFSQASLAVRAREETLAVVSHDLRNPLNTIVTSCELLDRQLPPERRGTRAYHSIRRASQQMNRLIHDLLDIARIEGGGLALRLEPVMVTTLFGDAVSLTRPLVDEKLGRLEIAPAESLPPVHGDRDRLLQVLSNLLGNAVNVIPPGGMIRLSARSQGKRVWIEVSDDGPGIAAEHLPHVFERFWRAEPLRRQGAGLGLNIAKGIVEAHGGTVRVKSRPGEGTTFSFCIPAYQYPATPSPPSPEVIAELEPR